MDDQLITVRQLFEQCVQAEKLCTMESFDNLRSALVRRLTFGGPMSGLFADKSQGHENLSDAELAAKYRHLLLAVKHGSKDERSRIFAAWAWAELDISPNDSIGDGAVEKLGAAQSNRVKAIPFNDLRYAGIIRSWLPYVERLFRDADRPGVARDALGKKLISLGYDMQAVQIFAHGEWRSPVAFTCAWLATRGGISMPKAHQDADIARTLQNAYSRIFGTGAPHTLSCIFCDAPAIADVAVDQYGSISYCAEHDSANLPTARSEGWIDVLGRRWWRSGTTIVCEPD